MDKVSKDFQDVFSDTPQLSAHSKQAVLNRTTRKENGSSLNRQLKPKQLLKNTLMPILVLISFIIGGFSVYYISSEGQSVPLTTGSITPILTEEEIEKSLLTLSSEAFTYLEKGDMLGLSQLVDPVEGITFAFYADFGQPLGKGYGGDYVNLLGIELNKAYDQQFIWGYDESEQNFELSLKDYIHNLLLQRYGVPIHYHQITYNEQAHSYGGVLNTIHDNYPSAKYVEYFGQIVSDDPLIKDNPHTYQSIRFVFQERGNTWYLIGIVRDIATG